KLSVWLNKECQNIEALNGYQVKFIPIKHQPDITTLKTKWTIGIFDANNFKHFERMNGRDKYITTDSEEKLERIINRFYRMKADGDGVFLSSNILNDNEWRLSHSNNRFIFSK
uniref:Uncharacterized protein n=1 Tax=Panagrolaimus sp. ES5 TaxID=591445 RepID=A0AC34GLE4_9BILA